MIIIDTNALIVLVIGLMDPRLLATHKTTSIYEIDDYNELTQVIGDIDKLIVLPNIWTEVDNKLNSFGGNYKYPYIQNITNLIKSTSEKYFESKVGITNQAFSDLGLTDSLILECAKDCDLLITNDSSLSDYAWANGIRVYDMVKARNEKLKK